MKKRKEKKKREVYDLQNNLLNAEKGMLPIVIKYDFELIDNCSQNS